MASNCSAEFNICFIAIPFWNIKTMLGPIFAQQRCVIRQYQILGRSSATCHQAEMRKTPGGNMWVLPMISLRI